SDGLWVGLADRAVCIGPHAAADSYLRVPNLIAAAETTGCDAVHPGWGFLAENAGFVRSCEDNDLVFVGPPAEAIELMGDKSRAMSRCRCWPTARATCWCWASGTARCSAGTRS